jgi:mRNA degradation ribonuclease J1/J2
LSLLLGGSPRGLLAPDPGLIREKVRVDLQRFFRKRSGRRPLVLPVIMEI